MGWGRCSGARFDTHRKVGRRKSADLGIAEARVAFIQKPYTAVDLLSKIRGVLRAST
jgi:hypothetical protein